MSAQSIVEEKGEKKTEVKTTLCRQITGKQEKVSHANHGRYRKRYQRAYLGNRYEYSALQLFVFVLNCFSVMSLYCAITLILYSEIDKQTLLSCV